MTFDATVSLGNLIQIVLLILAAFAAFFTLRGQVRILEEKIRAEDKQRDAYAASEREQRQTLAGRVDKLERQIESDIAKLGDKLDEGLRRIYDKLDRKADKP